MGRAPCCEMEGLNRGRWTSEEDETLIKYIEANGEGSWRSLPKNAGLLRCGKSCRLRWINYLRGDLKRGNITTEEEEIIVKLHASIGNRWSVIASQLPGRTDNEIKNYWKSHLRRKIYRFLRAKKSSPQASVDLTNILQMKRRTGRVSRRVAKKYNKNTVVAKIKSPPPSTSNESTKNRLNTETTNDQSIVSNEICLNNNGTAEDHFGGINLILEDIESQEPGPNEIGYQGDELMDIDAFFESWSVDSNGLLSLHDQQKIEKIFADLSAECDRKNNKEEEIFSLSSVDVTNTIQMKRRTGRISRSAAKYYIKNRVVAKIKSPPPSTSNESAQNRLNTERTDQSIVSNEICLNNNNAAEDHVGGINLILEDIENQELGPNEIGYQGDELMDIDALFESGSLDSNGLLSLHDQQQIEKIFADLSAECDRKNDKEDEIFSLSASVDVTNILQMKRRTGRTSRSVAESYNKNMVVAKIKSPPPSTTERTHGQSIVSNEICLNNNDTAEEHVGGINLILEDMENQELRRNEIGYRGDELMDIDAFFESRSMDSNGLLSLHDQQQIEKIFADLSAECDRKNDKEDEILSLSASHSLGFCSYKDHKEIGFDDDMMLWLWEEDNLELHRY